ncbi:MAG TPA: cyclic nucleotide-binding domain-containing protein [Candidatus Methanoperedens sp.]|nr:cyclic nucleotide-binding domain-containing protein [Candidatus Methanoperedens sp.]
MDREQVLFRLFGKYCPAGTILYTEGAPGEELFFVQSGAVKVSPAPGGAAGSAEVFGPDRVLGEEAFFGRVPRVARAEAVKDSRLLLVSDRSLEVVARHGPEVIRTVAERLLELAGAAAQRLDGWVLARQALRAEPHLRAAGPLTAASLAEHAGISERDAGSVLKALAERGALVREAGGYRMTEAATLERAVQELAAAAGEGRRATPGETRGGGD